MLGQQHSLQPLENASSKALISASRLLEITSGLRNGVLPWHCKHVGGGHAAGIQIKSISSLKVLLFVFKIFFPIKNKIMTRKALGLLQAGFILLCLVPLKPCLPPPESRLGSSESLLLRRAVYCPSGEQLEQYPDYRKYTFWA